MQGLVVLIHTDMALPFATGAGALRPASFLKVKALLKPPSQNPRSFGAHMGRAELFVPGKTQGMLAVIEAILQGTQFSHVIFRHFVDEVRQVMVATPESVKNRAADLIQPIFRPIPFGHRWNCADAAGAVSGVVLPVRPSVEVTGHGERSRSPARALLRSFNLLMMRREKGTWGLGAGGALDFHARFRN